MDVCDISHSAIGIASFDGRRIMPPSPNRDFTTIETGREMVTATSGVLRLSEPPLIDWLELVTGEDTASLAWLERSARRLASLPTGTIGGTRKQELLNRLERRDWMPADWKLIAEDMRKYGHFMT
jgi:hypothetical protein